MKIRNILVLAMLAAALMLATPVLAQANDAEATLLYQEGVAAAKAERYDEASRKLKRSFELKPSLDTAANLSFVESILGRKRDAAEHLAYAIRVHPSTGPTEKLKRMQKDLEALEKDVGRVTIQCPQGTVVTLNGGAVGIAPITMQYVDPGSVTISGKNDALGDGTVTIQATAGQTAVVNLELHRGKNGTDPPPSERAIWPAIVLGGVGAAGLGVGIAGLVVSVQKASDAEDLAQQVNTGGGCEAVPQLCADGEAAQTDKNTFLGVGIAGIVAGTAASIGMVIYLAIPSDEPTPTTALRFTPMFGPTSGISLQGTF